MALVVAASGTALAAGRYLITSSKQIKPGAIALGNLSRAARKALHGATGPQGKPRSAGRGGTAGTPGTPGTARAYGWVDTTPALAQPSHGVASVTSGGSPGQICITLAGGITPNQTGIVASPDYNTDNTVTGANGNQTVVEVDSGTGAFCPSGAFQVQTFVRTVTLTGGFVSAITTTPKNEPFSFIVP
ncbi:MAG TPA: hypothetical protein VIX82_17795 [Solirubrobacteraceae bacterium]